VRGHAVMVGSELASRPVMPEGVYELVVGAG